MMQRAARRQAIWRKALVVVLLLAFPALLCVAPANSPAEPLPTPTPTPRASATPTATSRDATPSPSETPEPVKPYNLTASPSDTNVEIHWRGNSRSYVVQVSADPAFSSPIAQTTKSETAFISGLSPATSYHARVAPSGAPDEVNTIDFTTTAVFTIPAPAPEQNGATLSELTVKWKAPEEGLSYQVELATDPAFTAVTRENTSAANVTFGALKGNTSYLLRLRGVADSQVVTDWSEPIEVATVAPVGLRVASYNILCANCRDGAHSWANRRKLVAKTIVDQDVDVVGLQEASYSSGSVKGKVAQFQDLANLLGSPYKLTEPKKSRKGGWGVRIIYNSERVKMLEHGVYLLPGPDKLRYLSWAIFEQLATGQRFFFSSTHLEPTNDKGGSTKYYNARKKQAQVVVQQIAANNPDKLPVIAVGDYNSTKFDKPTNAPYDIMQAAGYLDPLGNAYKSRAQTDGDFVEKRINTEYSSYNSFERHARKVSGGVNGSNPDYIFVSEMRVSEYETVVNLNKNGDWIGTIPSDHCMIRATVWLPED
jgi:endonuclease/exonuclease/phosphatase family metal-dependent hydrolase